MQVYQNMIAHRANLYGPNPETENSPKAIVEAINKGFDVEIDLHVDENENFYLGHDKPEYRVDFQFLHSIKVKAWIHCKTIEALGTIVGVSGFRYFFHNTDDCTLTSDNHIWTYPGKKIVSMSSVAVMPEITSPDYDFSNARFVCTDYPFKLLEDKSFRASST